MGENFVEYRDVIRKIRDKIRFENLSQLKLAESLKCSTNYISLMLNGKRKLNDEILELIGIEKITLYRVKNKEVFENVGVFRKQSE